MTGFFCALLLVARVAIIPRTRSVPQLPVKLDPGPKNLYPNIVIDEQRIRQFQEAVWEYYAAQGRHNLPWRQPEADGSIDPYKILVSELMLQQTQVPRVIPKYHEFLGRFPTMEDLAGSPLGEVLKVWQGLGYNRRAKYLCQAAQMVLRDFSGALPRAETELVKLPGIGKNTAAAIVAYAYDQKAVFIETNIRTVFIHHFHADSSEVTDKDILPLVALTLPQGKEQPETRIYSAPGAMRKTGGLSHVRDWYWALMDYGSYLKKTVGNLNKLSKNYVKQSSFHGSKRQLRGSILRMLSERQLTKNELLAQLSDERTSVVLAELIREGMVHQTAGRYSL